LPVKEEQSLATDPGRRFNIVMTDRPFSVKPSVLVINAKDDQECNTLTVVREVTRETLISRWTTGRGWRTLVLSGGRARDGGAATAPSAEEVSPWPTFP
jgi:hypothetical protein